MTKSSTTESKTDQYSFKDTGSQSSNSEISENTIPHSLNGMESPLKVSTALRQGGDELLSADKTPDDMFDDAQNKLTLSLRRQTSLVETKNDHLDFMESDYLYHLGLTKVDASDFSDVKYLVVGGTNDRMTKFANALAAQLGVEVQSVGLHKRYVIYRLGSVLVCSHGMGGPSISILLHELAKLLKYANADCVWIRIGTCGGVGVPPGTLVLTQQSVNGALEPWHETIVLGERIRRSTMFKPEMNLEIMKTC